MRCVHTHSSLTILDALVRRTEDVPFPDATRYGENHVEIANLSNHAAPAAPPAPLNYRDPL